VARVTKEYIGKDVLVEAKARINHIFDLHDTVTVSVSGGKDSLVVLYLVKEVQEERGLEGPVRCQFFDHEFFPLPLLEDVWALREQPWVDMWYLTVPLTTTRFVLGRSSKIIFWDPQRPWARERPEFGWTGEPGVTYTQEMLDCAIADRHPGKVAILTGLRAAESLVRWRASVNKQHDNYINGSGSHKASLCKPIFDWQEKDVYRYMWERGIPVPKMYLLMAMVGLHGGRTSTVTHHVAAQYFDKMRLIDPDLYERTIEIFPDLKLQSLYWQEFDRDAILDKFGKTYSMARHWIDTYVTDPERHAKAVKMFEDTLVRAERSPYAYNPRYVLAHFVYGNFNKTIQPIGADPNASE
jgi:predicted phosphoadenosine phosphosulfate sulfurtransferase